MGSGAVTHQELQSGLEAALGQVLGEYTVVRSLVNLAVKHTDNTASPDNLGMGIVIAGRDAAAAGTTSLPTPLQNPHADWLWWWCGAPPGYESESAAGVFVPVHRYVEFDVRAMRKVQERDEVPVLVLENSVGVSSAYSGSISLLLLRT